MTDDLVGHGLHQAIQAVLRDIRASRAGLTLSTPR